ATLVAADPCFSHLDHFDLLGVERKGPSKGLRILSSEVLSPGLGFYSAELEHHVTGALGALGKSPESPLYLVAWWLMAVKSEGETNPRNPIQVTPRLES